MVAWFQRPAALSVNVSLAGTFPSVQSGLQGRGSSIIKEYIQWQMSFISTVALQSVHLYSNAASRASFSAAYQPQKKIEFHLFPGQLDRRDCIVSTGLFKHIISSFTAAYVISRNGMQLLTRGLLAMQLAITGQQEGTICCIPVHEASPNSHLHHQCSAWS